MGFLDFFSNSPAVSPKWNVPETTADIETIFSDSDGTHLIYKHSFSCSICLFSLRRLESSIDEITQKCQAHFIDVRSHRALSNKVSERSGVRHESPQALLIFKGEVYWHDSHGSVQAGPVLESLNELYP